MRTIWLILTAYARHRLAMRLLCALYADPNTAHISKGNLQSHARKAARLYYCGAD